MTATPSAFVPDMKRCRKCGTVKPIAQFYAMRGMADGHRNECKLCFNREGGARYRQRVSTAEGLAKSRAAGRANYNRHYRVGPNWQVPEASREEKKRATNAVNNAVRDGLILKPRSCSKCGRYGRIHGHHNDYAKQLDVIWLCTACHRKEHATHPERVRGAA